MLDERHHAAPRSAPAGFRRARTCRARAPRRKECRRTRGPARVVLSIVGATVRTLPSSCVPSAVVSFTSWPTRISRMRDSGISARHSTRPLRNSRSISRADLRDLTDVHAARGDDAVVRRSDARVAQAQLGSLQFGLARLRRVLGRRALRCAACRGPTATGRRSRQRLRASIRRCRILQRRLRLLEIGALRCDFRGEHVVGEAHELLALAHAIADVDVHGRDAIAADLGADDDFLPAMTPCRWR